MYVVSGEAKTLLFEFIVDGEFVSPTDVSYTLLDGTGTAVTGYTAVPLTAAPQVVVMIPASQNTLATGRRLESRTVKVLFTVDGIIHTLTQRYMLHPSMNIVVSEDQVRSALGMYRDEVGNSDVDLVKAYLQVEGTLGQTVLETALSAGDLSTLNANNAILYKAALNIVPSLMMRAPARRVTDNVEFHRFGSPKFDVLQEELQAHYDEAVQAIDTGAELLPVTLFSTTTPTDPITNA